MLGLELHLATVMFGHHHQPRLCKLLQRLVAALVVLLAADPASAAVFAPVCDASAQTLPVEAPAAERDDGMIDAWDCARPVPGPGGLAIRLLPPSQGDSDSSPTTHPIGWAVPAAKVAVPPRPISKRPGTAEASSAPRRGYANGTYRPPQLTCAA